MGGGGTTTTTVDKKYNARMATIAEEQQAMAQTYFDFWEEAYKPMEEAQIAANMQLIPSETELQLAQNESAMSLLPTQTALTKAQAQYGINAINAKSPVMQEFYNQSLNGVDVEGRVNRAAADATQAFAGSTAQTARNAARMGISPSSGAFSSALNNNSIEQAKAVGGAKTQARTGAEQENYQRLTQAMSY